MIAPMIIRAALWLLALSLLFGQLVRIPVAGQSGGLLVSDIVVVLVLITSYTQYLSRLLTIPPAGGIPRHGGVANYLLLTTPFITWSLFTLIINAPLLETTEVTIAALYWVRTSCYLMLIPALAFVMRDKKIYHTGARSFLLAGSALVILGLLQVALFPNLGGLPSFLLSFAGDGWDPHEGRAVSTWLDPNFFGAFVSLFLLYVINPKLRATNRHQRVGYGLCALLSAGTLILTQSRSSLIALILTSLVISPIILLRLTRQTLPRLAAPAIVSVVSLCSIVALLAAFALGDRLVGLVHFDPTVQARSESLVATWRLAAERPWVGVGYNAFQFAAEKSGVTNNPAFHSRAGSDNSWLTLAVTTGLPGALLFALPWLVIAMTGVTQWLRRGEVQPLLVAASVLVLMIHSQFVNSFLYAHLLLTLAYITALSPRSSATVP